MTDLNELQYFVHVSQAQSFTEAAKRLNVPKSSVSRAVTRLERRLGIRLMARTTRTVGLTEAGEVYLRHCKRILDEAEEADLAIGGMVGAPRGTLRVAAPVAFARGILAPVLSSFLHRYPELRLQLELLNTNRAYRDGHIDVIIHPGPLADSGLLVTPIMRIHLGLFASPGYIAKHAAPQAPADLCQHACVSTSCGTAGERFNGALWRLRNGSEVREIRINSRAAMPDPSMNYELACAGVGIAILNCAAVAKDVEQGRLVPVLPDWQPDAVELHALYSERLSTSPKVRVFIEFLRQR